MSAKLTRRDLAAVAFSAAAAAQAAAQTAEPSDELASAKQRNQRNAQALNQVDLPMSTEPAFQFKA